MMSNQQKQHLRVQSQAAVAVDATPAAVRDTVLYELYHHSPTITTEDLLELAVLVSPPQRDSRERQVEDVLTDALEQLEQWERDPEGNIAELRDI